VTGEPGRIQRGDWLVEAVIEDPRGSTTRHHFDPDRREWVEARHPYSTTPWPASYGYLPGVYNPVDDDALDTLVLATDPLPTGTRLVVRPVGLLARPDGDHKVLSVAAGDPTYGGIERFEEVPRREIARIEGWFEEWSQLGHWQDERAAREQIIAFAKDGSDEV
jgi:inorganic pyrophosphatase